MVEGDSTAAVATNVSDSLVTNGSSTLALDGGGLSGTAVSDPSRSFAMATVLSSAVGNNRTHIDVQTPRVTTRPGRSHAPNARHGSTTIVRMREVTHPSKPQFNTTTTLLSQRNHSVTGKTTTSSQKTARPAKSGSSSTPSKASSSDVVRRTTLLIILAILLLALVLTYVFHLRARNRVEWKREQTKAALKKKHDLKDGAAVDKEVTVVVFDTDAQKIEGESGSGETSGQKILRMEHRPSAELVYYQR